MGGQGLGDRQKDNTKLSEDSAKQGKSRKCMKYGRVPERELVPREGNSKWPGPFSMLKEA
jgi:hypothetical protein